jgi:hypothetical protein
VNAAERLDAIEEIRQLRADVHEVDRSWVVR